MTNLIIILILLAGGILYLLITESIKEQRSEKPKKLTKKFKKTHEGIYWNNTKI